MKANLHKHHLCAYCGRKVLEVNPNRKVQYCSPQCLTLHTTFIRKHSL